MRPAAPLTRFEIALGAACVACLWGALVLLSAAPAPSQLVPAPQVVPTLPLVLPPAVVIEERDHFRYRSGKGAFVPPRQRQRLASILPHLKHTRSHA